MPRQFPSRPIVGVGIVLIKDNSVLLVQRAKPPRQGAWSLPGGAVEIGETLEEAVRRELYEETNIEAGRLHFLEVVELIDRVDEGIRHHYTLIDYAAAWSSGEPRAGDDAMDVGWFDKNQLDGLALWEKTRRVILSALALDLR